MSSQVCMKVLGTLAMYSNTAGKQPKCFSSALQFQREKENASNIYWPTVKIPSPPISSLKVGVLSTKASDLTLVTELKSQPGSPAPGLLCSPSPTPQMAVAVLQCSGAQPISHTAAALLGAREQRTYGFSRLMPCHCHMIWCKGKPVTALPSQ